MFHVPRAIALGTWNIFYIFNILLNVYSNIRSFLLFRLFGWGFGTSFVPVRYCILKCRYLGTKHVKNVHENPVYVENFYFLFV